MRTHIDYNNLGLERFGRTLMSELQMVYVNFIKMEIVLVGEADTVFS